MRRLLVMAAILLSVSVVALVPGRVLAVEVINCPPELANTVACQESQNQNNQGNPLYGPDGIITKAISLLSWVAGVIAIVMVMIAGFKYVIASGDSSNVSSAKNTLMYALIGFAIAAVARALVLFVLNKLGL